MRFLIFLFFIFFSFSIFLKFLIIISKFPFPCALMQRSRSGSMKRTPATTPESCSSAAISMSPARSHSHSTSSNGSNSNHHCKSESFVFDAELDSEVARLVLWRRPLATLRFAALDAIHWLSILVNRHALCLLSHILYLFI